MFKCQWIRAVTTVCMQAINILATLLISEMMMIINRKDLFFTDFACFG